VVDLESNLKDKLYIIYPFIFIFVLGLAIGCYYGETTLKNDLIKYSQYNAYGKQQAFRFDDSNNYYYISKYELKHYYANITDNKNNTLMISGVIYPNNPVTIKQMQIQNNIRIKDINSIFYEQ
jgi:hypothetical protein